jgi:ankyrin repeat protein
VRQNGRTPLGIAAAYGKVDSILALVDLGADVNAMNKVRTS